LFNSTTNAFADIGGSYICRANIGSSHYSTHAELLDLF
jgi:hypothetical protein